MCKKSSKIVSRLLVVALLFAMLLMVALPTASLAAETASVSSVSVSTTPGSTENLRYFKEDTSYDMSEKINTPMTIEFEITGCGSIPGATPGGVIVGNYSENAATYVNVEVAEWGLLRVRGRYNSGSEWVANFYSSEGADIRLNGVHHYTITIGSGWTGVSLYVDGVHKATRYPASLTLPKASEYTNPFRIGGDYSSGNKNYFKGLIYSVAMYNDIRTASEIKSDTARTKNWNNSDGLIAAYDITKMGEAALRDYSGNGNKLIYNNGSGIQVENFGKYEIDQAITSGIETFEAWVYMPKSMDNKSIGGTIVGNYRSYNGARIMLEVYLKGNPRLSYTNAEGKTSYHRFTDVDLRTGTWQHLTVVHDTVNGEARCYVDGELKQTVTENVVSYSSSALDQKFLIGRDTALRYAEGDGEYWENRMDQYFKGFIKELRLYSDVRSAEEISADYAGDLDKSELIAAYEINPEDAYTNLIDLSGNGYDANYKQLLWEAEYVEPINNNYSYSLAIVGDTQTVADQNPELLKNIYQWILDNQTAKNIQYVIGLGDITEYGVDVGHKNYEEARANAQWTAAKEAISLMDGKIPYSLIRGDGHDGIELFNKYFANHEGYTSNIAGYYEEGRIDNVYHTFKAGSVDYLLLSLDHGTKDDVLVWANEVIAAHPDHRVIVTTHQYLESNGTLSERGETGNATAYDPNNNAADDLWNKLLCKHPNIAMIICGHSDSNDVVVTKQIGNHGNEVTQVLINPQSMDAEYAQGSKGMVAMLYFSEDGNEVQVQYYSTIKDTYRPTSNFTVSTGTHNYEPIVTEPTCTEGGYTTYTCAGCGDSYVDGEVSAKGHTEDVLPAVAPTCTATGLTEGKKCTACGVTTVDQSVVPANGHSYSTSFTEPTCTEVGYTTYTCTVCGYGYVADEVSAKGHTEDVIPAVAPTCTATGLTESKKCTVCGVTTVEQSIVPANGHKYDAEVTAPDCLTGGYTTYTCSVCGDSYVADEVAALGHSYSVVVTAPTCESAGFTTYTCSACGDAYTAEPTSALGHNYVGVQTLAPTCTDKGVETYTCQNDSTHTYTKEISALGHSYDATVTAPTCTDKGYTSYTCSACGDTYVTDEVAALGHSYDSVVFDPTCTTGGYTTNTCSVCGDVYITDETEALGHTAGEVLQENVVAPDCVNDGSFDEAVYCVACNEELSRVSYTILARGHSGGTATCYNPKICFDCGEYYGEPLGHSFTNYVHDGNATCTEDGTKTAYCDHGCGDFDTLPNTGFAPGHDWTEATTEAPKTCKACGATDGEKLPTEDNTPNDETETKPDATPDEEVNHDECESENEIIRIINIILNFIRSLLGLDEKCVCEEDFKL